jgi:histidine ammonia-lyase
MAKSVQRNVKVQHKIRGKAAQQRILKLGDRALSLEEVRDVAVAGRTVELSSGALKRIKAARRFLEQEVESGKTMYGVNTGFGLLSNVRIPEADVEALQYNLIRSHACGVGAPLSDAQVRAMLLLRATNLTAGHSGVRLETVQMLVDLLNRGVCPIVPEQGSVGASGDLAPLSHLALVLIGEGRARLEGVVMTGAEALRRTGLAPIRLGAKEGLALINGTQFMTAIGTLALLEAEHLADIADYAGAMSCEALRGTATAFDERIHKVRPHPGQVRVARRMRDILLTGGKSSIARSHVDCSRVQDPYSLRCIPQVHGASRDLIAFVRGVLEREVNSVTDNPLIFPASKGILSGGNFHGQIVSVAMDALCIATAELASISEQRLEKLINPAISELPAFLTKSSGLNSGFMIVQVAAASIVSENKTLCHPASVDTIPTSADKEDHVSMGAWASRKAHRVIVNSRRVIAMELLAAAQGIDLLRPLRSSRRVESVYSEVRKRAAFMDSDRSLTDEIHALEEMIATSALSKLVS